MKTSRSRAFLTALSACAALGLSAPAIAQQDNPGNQVLAYCQHIGHANSQCPGYQAPSHPPIIWGAYYLNTEKGVGAGASWRGGSNPQSSAISHAHMLCKRKQNGCPIWGGKKAGRWLTWGGTLNMNSAAVAVGYNAETGRYQAEVRWVEGYGDAQELGLQALQSCQRNGWQNCHIDYTEQASGPAGSAGAAGLAKTGDPHRDRLIEHMRRMEEVKRRVPGWHGN